MNGDGQDAPAVSGVPQPDGPVTAARGEQHPVPGLNRAYGLHPVLVAFQDTDLGTAGGIP